MENEEKRQRGRFAGSKNRKTEQRLALAARAEERMIKSGVTPLDVMRKVMEGDLTITDRQLDAAKAAAPYIHPKLSAIQMDATVRRSIADLSDEELAALAADGEGSA